MTAAPTDRLQLFMNGACVADLPLWYVFFKTCGCFPMPGVTVDARFHLAGAVHSVVVNFPTKEEAE
jgi:hypothetical protein